MCELLGLVSCWLEGEECVSALLSEELVVRGFSSVTAAGCVLSNCRTSEAAGIGRKNCPLWKVYNEDNQSLY